MHIQYVIYTMSAIHKSRRVVALVTPAPNVSPPPISAVRVSVRAPTTSSVPPL